MMRDMYWLPPTTPIIGEAAQPASCTQINDGQWYGRDGKRRVVTQYYETIGYFWWAKYIVQILVIINLFGTNVSQVMPARMVQCTRLMQATGIMSHSAAIPCGLLEAVCPRGIRSL